jgi:hypothetical protein
MIGNFDEQEYNDLVTLLSTVKDYIEPSQIHPLWNAYNKLNGSSEPAPCTCNPRRWNDAVNHLRQFTSENAK